MTPEAVIPTHVATKSLRWCSRACPNRSGWMLRQWRTTWFQQWGGRLSPRDAELYESLTAAAAAAGVIGVVHTTPSSG